MKITLTINQLKKLIKERSEKELFASLPTSYRAAQIVNQWYEKWDGKKDINTSFDGFVKWLKDKGYDTTGYSPREYDRDWDVACDMENRNEVEDEEEEKSLEFDGEIIEDKRDAKRWLNRMLDEYGGNTYHFPENVKRFLNRLINKFGNTYFW